MHTSQLLTNEWYTFGVDDTTRKEMKVILCPFDHYCMACIISSLQDDIDMTFISIYRKCPLYLADSGWNYSIGDQKPRFFILLPSENVTLTLICSFSNLRQVQWERVATKVLHPPATAEPHQPELTIWGPIFLTSLFELSLTWPSHMSKLACECNPASLVRGCAQACGWHLVRLWTSLLQSSRVEFLLNIV